MRRAFRPNPGRSAALLLAGALGGGGCQHVPVADPTTAAPSVRLEVRLPDIGDAKRRTAGIWIARPLGKPFGPLVLHLTGDSGRHGLDLQLFTAVTSWGYPIAVLGSPDWIGTFPDGVATRPSLARDIDSLSRAAARAMGVPEDERVVLLGQSRGAALAVEAAAEASWRERLLGVIALGLCPDEEHVRLSEGLARPYRDKALLSALPIEVIQSTRDHYMSASAARKAFGPDTELHALHPIMATSHTFGGGRDALLEQLKASLARVAAARRATDVARDSAQ